MKSILKIASSIFRISMMLIFSSNSNGQAMLTISDSEPDRVVEIRTYNLKDNSREKFHSLFVDKAMPLLKKWDIHVVGYGPSLHDKNTYTLIREYQNIEQMQKSEDAFYASDEWRKGPREEVLALIENYTTLVLSADQALINGLHKSLKN